MSKLKKIAIAIIIAVITILGIYTISDAYYVGQSITLTKRQYKTSNNIYCMERLQSTINVMHYTVISNVTIEGTKSTDHTGKTIDSKDNARLAYILSQNNGPVKSTGPVQNAIWNFADTWMRNVGQYHAGLYNGFASTNHGSSNWVDQAAKEYADSLEENSKVVDNTNKENIQVTAYEKDGKNYMRVGPFNWTFGGTLSEINVYDQDSNPISEKLYSKYIGETENFITIQNIESGSDFYISVPLDGNTTSITKVTGKMQLNIKCVNIWFLEATEGYLQNMIIVKPYEKTDEIDIEFDYDITTTGHLRIVKVNKDNHEFKLPGVGFFIMNNELGQYVKQDEEGNITYVDTKEEATEFITDANG